MTANSELELLSEVARQVLERTCTSDRIDDTLESGGDRELWDELEAAGLTLISVPEEFGGSGGALELAAELIRRLGAYSAPVPVVETVVCGHLLAATNTVVPQGALVFVDGTELTTARARDEVLIAGRAASVPWASFVSHIALLVDLPNAAPVDPGGATIRTTESELFLVLLNRSDSWSAQSGTNLVGEPREEVNFECRIDAHRLISVSRELVADARVHARLGRSLLMVGAIERVLQMTCFHLEHRQQFGKPLARMQVLQQHTAEMAGAFVSARVAVDAAVSIVATNQDPAARTTAVAVAKACANRSASQVVRAGHQLHGAIGTTLEHRLRHSTLRLRSWQQEDGSDKRVNLDIAAKVVTSRSPEVWNWLTDS